MQGAYKFILKQKQPLTRGYQGACKGLINYFKTKTAPYKGLPRGLQGAYKFILKQKQPLTRGYQGACKGLISPYFKKRESDLQNPSYI
ncbi:hypothetical protein [Clostridium botulinum]|uniref:hypothetical protein n=1 Tax=Clostridium botulinum TaxID=1491 RepID=UPI001E5DD1F3|nr:hypothetical protein [Clostridium botulinum]MCD3340435.1 hypothetical protein [Clostridium botulinum C/D]